MHLVDRRWHEAVVEIEVPGSNIDCMNQHSANPDDIACLSTARKGVTQKCSSQALALFPGINRKPRQQDHSDGVLGQSLGDAFRRLIANNGPGHERVVSNDNSRTVRHIGLRRFRPLIGPCETLQPCVQGVVRGLKIAQFVGLRQPLDDKR